MSTRDKSDFGSGKILPDELPDSAASATDGVAAVEHGAHFRADDADAVPDEPVAAPHPPKHAQADGDAVGAPSPS
ncbi:hypothetical protein [Isoptericola croceus]|uniref:hypothetical protein n=1 Tax=Isoptericola croceus TaxID=3031406 RepID=UPI0023F7B122|nr:hypothetical protein [Isoptericola croceus]